MALLARVAAGRSGAWLNGGAELGRHVRHDGTLSKFSKYSKFQKFFLPD
jgi:hypothetical protein